MKLKTRNPRESQITSGPIPPRYFGTRHSTTVQCTARRFCRGPAAILPTNCARLAACHAKLARSCYRLSPACAGGKLTTVNALQPSN